MSRTCTVKIRTFQQVLIPSQAKEKAAEQRQRKVCDEHDNFTEIANNIHGDLLSENPDVAKSAFGSHRVVPDRWKGMSPQQVREVREVQERQIEEKKVGMRQTVFVKFLV